MKKIDKELDRMFNIISIFIKVYAKYQSIKINIKIYINKLRIAMIKLNQDIICFIFDIREY